MMKETKRTLETLYKNHFDCVPEEISPLLQGGSDRRYFRLAAGSQSAIGAYNPNVDENRTFFYLTQHFSSLGFPVPKLLMVSDNERFYLLSDLGNRTLFDILLKTDWNDPQTGSIIEVLKKTLRLLAQFQVEGAKGLDFSKCYPKSDFDVQSVMWDFNYFKYCFLKPSGIKFNEVKLDEDFLVFANMLLSQPSGYFHYRDFQSRNVMLVGENPFFIDYQGGKKGPLLYDLVSFLYQARANFPESIRDNMLNFYLDEVEKLAKIDKIFLVKVYPVFALFRVIQTLGAYGYRGFFERRAHFLQSIPLAASNLKPLISRIDDCGLILPTLKPLLGTINQKFAEQTERSQTIDGLTLEIASFSYKKGYPIEHPEHGGGFVFDCRALPNPGRLNEYKLLTGNDIPVIVFLNRYREVDQFFNRVHTLVKESVDVYRNRSFNFLSVSFGCTGGQHRSVYMANKLAQTFKNVNGVRVVLSHRELKI